MWRHADSWPVPATLTPMYLSGDKKLSAEKGTVSGKYAFESDPKNPVPTLGGKNLFLGSGPKDQRPIEDRGDDSYIYDGTFC